MAPFGSVYYLKTEDAASPPMAARSLPGKPVFRQAGKEKRKDGQDWLIAESIKSLSDNSILMRAGILFILILASAAFATSCEADVIDAYVDISVREYSGGGIFTSIKTDSLSLYEYSPLFNHTRIYLAGIDSSDMCSASCKDERPSEFTANFVVITEYGGSYEVVEVFDMIEGEESQTITSEGREFSFITSDFWSKLSCDEYEDEEYDYCSDGTRKRKCSYTRPYRCVENEDDDLELEFQPGFCGEPNWLEYSEECAYGEIYFCDASTNSVMRKSCEGTEWLTVFVEDCGDAQCMFNATFASCSPLVSNSCSDGTIRGGCSVNKPYYCNEDAILIESPKICGCPEGSTYEPATFSCLYTQCSDGTPVGQCSGYQYCNDNAQLIGNPAVCGCPEGYLLQNNSCIQEQQPEVNETVSANETQNETVNVTPSEEPSRVVDVTPPKPPAPKDEGIPLGLIFGAILVIMVAVLAYAFFRD
jgi:hypothetical protein